MSKLTESAKKKILKAGTVRGIAKKVLMYDNLHDKALPHYESMIGNVRSVEITKNNKIKFIEFHLDPPNSLKGVEAVDDFMCPIVTYKTSMDTKRKKDIKESIAEFQDVLFVNMMRNLANDKNTKYFRTYSKKDDLFDVLYNSFADLETSWQILSNCLMNHNTFISFMEYVIEKGETIEKIRHLATLSKYVVPQNKNIVGSVWSATVMVSDLIPEDQIYIFPAPKYLGALPYYDYEVTKNDSGYELESKFGMFIGAQSYGIVKLKKKIC